MSEHWNRRVERPADSRGYVENCSRYIPLHEGEDSDQCVRWNIIGPRCLASISGRGVFGSVVHGVGLPWARDSLQNKPTTSSTAKRRQAEFNQRNHEKLITIDPRRLTLRATCRTSREPPNGTRPISSSNFSSTRGLNRNANEPACSGPRNIGRARREGCR